MPKSWTEKRWGDYSEETVDPAWRKEPGFYQEIRARNSRKQKVGKPSPDLIYLAIFSVILKGQALAHISSHNRTSYAKMLAVLTSMHPTVEKNKAY